MHRFVSCSTILLAMAAQACGPPSNPSGDGGGVDGRGDGQFGVPGTPPAELSACPANPAGGSTNMDLCTATYLGGAGADKLGGVDLAPDGTIVYAATLPDENFGVTPGVLMGGGSGAVVRLRASGGAVLSVTRVGAEVSDVEVRANEGTIAVVGASLGVALLAPDAGSLRWQRVVDGASRVSIGADGTVAVLRRGGVTLFDSAGTEIKQIALSDSTLNDVAVHGHGALVIVTGFNQVGGNLQWPFLRAYRYDGSVAWADYAYTTADGLTSDTRGLRVAMGRDDKLYYAGRSDGAVTAHARDPQNFSANANIVRTDRYSESSNWNGAAPLAFFARFNPDSGALDRGQFLAPRLNNGKGNGATIEAITADETGSVLIGGGSACCIENTPPRTLQGIASLEGYAGGAFFAVISPDFSKRLHWNAFPGATTKAVAAANGAVVLAVQQDADRTTGVIGSSLLTVTPLQTAPRGGASETFLAVGRAFR